MPNENAEYHHHEHGRVRVMDIDDGTVAYEHTSETVDVAGRVPKTWAESVEQFDSRTDPVDLTVGVSCETVTIE